MERVLESRGTRARASFELSIRLESGTRNVPSFRVFNSNFCKRAALYVGGEGRRRAASAVSRSGVRRRAQDGRGKRERERERERASLQFSYLSRGVLCSLHVSSGRPFLLRSETRRKAQCFEVFVKNGETLSARGACAARWRVCPRRCGGTSGPRDSTRPPSPRPPRHIRGLWRLRYSVTLVL